jgi:hypothetical protein
VDRHLTRDEDLELRRLAALASFGRLSGPTAVLLEELRANDRRTSIREPIDVVVPMQSGAAAPEVDASI